MKPADLHLPPQDLQLWTKRGRGREYGSFIIEYDSDGNIGLPFKADMMVWHEGLGPRRFALLSLGRHPDASGATAACRDIAGALQRAKRHQQELAEPE